MKRGANHPIGPLALADLVSFDVCVAVMDLFVQDFGDTRYRACPLLHALATVHRRVQHRGTSTQPEWGHPVFFHHRSFGPGQARRQFAQSLT